MGFSNESYVYLSLADPDLKDNSVPYYLQTGNIPSDSYTSLIIRRLALMRLRGKRFFKYLTPPSFSI